MNARVLESIERKTGISGIAGLLANGLTGSEWSSLLLAVFERRTSQLKPAELLAKYQRNRLVQPAASDMIALMEAELATLRFWRERGFAPVELSPVAAIGSCSVVASVSQDKVVSAVRNTEIVADATNMLALQVADRRKQGEDGVIRLCTVHRHVRTQPLPSERHMPHFVIGCKVTAGRDTGGNAFECAGIAEHIGCYFDLLREVFGFGQVRLYLMKRAGYDERSPLFERVERLLRARMPELEIRLREPGRESNYYKGLQFKLYVVRDGAEWEIADGGFVDWTQRLLENRKERLLISGLGLEWLCKMKGGLM